MSSDTQSTFKLAQQQGNDYSSLVVLTAVSYDLCLMFPREVTYIWRKPWTRVSLLYLLIRYAGYLSAVSTALIYSALVPITLKTEIGCVEGSALYLLGTWAYPIFWAGADMVMILRVYAMYRQSKAVLVILLLIYLVEIVSLLVSSGVYSNPHYITVSTAQLLDVTVCNLQYYTQTWSNTSTIAQFILAIAMCSLVTAQLIIQSLQMYQSTRKWQLNRYMGLLVRDGLIYFLVTVLYALVNMLTMMSIIPMDLVSQVLLATSNIPLYTLTPRFVMNVRELYALDKEGRCEGGIDTGFGLSGGSVHSRDTSSTLGTIAFAEGGGREAEKPDDEEITIGERPVDGSSK